jgi:hypothetical protein
MAVNYNKNSFVGLNPILDFLIYLKNIVTAKKKCKNVAMRLQGQLNSDYLSDEKTVAALSRNTWRHLTLCRLT